MSKKNFDAISAAPLNMQSLLEVLHVIVNNGIGTALHQYRFRGELNCFTGIGCAVHSL